MKTLALFSAVVICGAWIIPAMVAGRLDLAILGWVAAFSFAIAIALAAPGRGAFDPIDRPGLVGGESGGWYRPPGALARRRGAGGGRIAIVLILFGMAFVCAGAALYSVF